MITRREAIASGLAVSALAQAPALSLAGSSRATGVPPVRRFVADVRYPEARAAASAAKAGGAAIESLTRDVTGLYQSLDLAWRSAPFAIAGVTTNNALFVIERLGWERGLRTVYRGIHRRGADGRFRHELLGTPAWIRRLDLPPTPAWAARVGEALTASPPVVVDRRHYPPQTLPGISGVTLVSWQLVPKSEH